MDPREFYEHAKRLASSEAGPAELRTAVSRAYYAAYHVAHNTLKSLGLNPAKDTSGHSDVRGFFNSAHDHTLAILAQTLGDLHGKRLDADYELDDDAVERLEIVNRIVARSERVITGLVKRCQEPDRDALVAAMAEWEASPKRRKRP